MVVRTEPSNKETRMLNTTDKIIKHKTGLLNLAEELGNVSKACQVSVVHGSILSKNLRAYRVSSQRKSTLTTENALRGASRKAMI